MAYTPPAGGSVGLSFADGYAPPTGQSTNLEFDAGFLRGRVRAAGGFDASALPVPGVRLKSRPLVTKGSDTALIPRPAVALDIPRIRPVGIDATAVAGTPEYVRWRRFLSPSSIEPLASFYSVERVRLPGGYNSPPGGSVVVNWFADPYAPPPGSSVLVEFGAVGYGYVWPGMGDQALFGLPGLVQPTGMRPAGIAPGSFGLATVQSTLNNLRVSGFDGQAFGTAALTKSATALLPGGIAASGYGTALVYNLRQYLVASGISSLVVGVSYVSGGIKAVSVSGIAPPPLGAVTVVNSKASQTAAPAGIASPVIIGPTVSPRMLYPNGIAAPGLGAVFVQRNPTPTGWDAALFGQASIEYKTKYLLPRGIAAVDLGYPIVFDPTQWVFPSSPVDVGPFGDSRVTNKSVVVKLAGLDALELSPWALVENTRRYLLLAGWDSLAAGGGAIANKTPSVAPQGFDALGKPSSTETGVGFAVRSLYLSGIASPGIGAPTLTKTPEISPSGFTGAIGLPTVWPRVRNVAAKGADSQALGSATVWFRYRYLPAQGFASDKYGSGRIDHSWRELIATGTAMSAYGTPTVDNSDRTIAPASIFEFFAANHMVGGLRFLRPVGYDAAQFGSRIIPEVQQVYPLGFSGTYGLASIRNYTQLVVPPGFLTVGKQPADRWGTANAYNLVQYISMYYDPDSGLNTPAWPQWTLIENRNHNLRATGNDLSRPGIPQIDNKAAPLFPEGIRSPDPEAFYKAGMVAYRVRRLRLDGLEPPYIPSWATVYNDAFVAAPAGISSPAAGLPKIENTRRTFERIGGFDSAVFGYPMIADRVRTLSFEPRYTIGPPVIQLPEVKLYTRYVEPRGDDLSGLGWASLSIHWTLITPRWTLQNLYGSPTVWNVTPELHTRGSASDEFGDTFVRLQWRPVQPDGALTQEFGKADIAFRDRSVTVMGLRAGAFGDKLTVVRTGAPPYSTQYITLDGEPGKDGFGIPPGDDPPRSQMGLPIMNQQVIYVKQDDVATRIGSHSVTANSVRVEPGYWELLIGDPMVSLKIRTLTVPPYDYQDADYQGKPRVTPHTIWAMTEAPEQAKRNHPTTLPLHPIDGYGRTPGAILGNVTVTNQNRRLQATGTYFTSFGASTVQLRRHYIRPTGFTSFRSGWHMVPGDQYAEQFNGVDSAVFGQAKVAPPPPVGAQTAKPLGIVPPAIDKQAVDFFNRTVKPSGFDSAALGTRKGGDTPYMWQGLRVGPLMPTIPTGLASQAVAQPWVSFRVREAKVSGFDAFLCEYQLEAFDKRLRVKRVDPPRASRSITPVGILGFSSSASDVKPGVRFIRPDGNADQYRKGAF